MNIKERFLEEVKTGSNVDLIVGPKELLGKVISLDSESVQIIKHDGKCHYHNCKRCPYDGCCPMQEDKEKRARVTGHEDHQAKRV